MKRMLTNLQTVAEMPMEHSVFETRWQRNEERQQAQKWAACLTGATQWPLLPNYKAENLIWPVWVLMVGGGMNDINIWKQWWLRVFKMFGYSMSKCTHRIKQTSGHNEESNERRQEEPLTWKESPLCFTLGWPHFLLVTPNSTVSQKGSRSSILMRTQLYILLIRDNSLIFFVSHWVTFLHCLFALNAAEKWLCL